MSGRTVEAFTQQIRNNVADARAALLGVIEMADDSEDGKLQAIYAARAIRALACIDCDCGDMVDGGVQMSPVVSLPATPARLDERIDRVGSRKR